MINSRNRDADVEFRQREIPKVGGLRPLRTRKFQGSQREPGSFFISFLFRFRV